MMDKPYHVVKSSRIYHGVGYSGPTAEQLSIPAPWEFETIEEAIYVANAATSANPQGWNVINANTQRIVYGELFPTLDDLNQGI